MRNGTPIQELSKPAFNSPEWFNQTYPIVKARKYNHGLELIRDCPPSIAKESHAKRGKISGLSKQSLRRLAFLTFTTPIEFTSILTLTYGSPPPNDGSIIKLQLDCFLTAMRRAFGKFAFLWWLEFQEKRCAPHFHLLLTLPAPSRAERQVMGKLWAKWSFLNSPMELGEYEKVLKVHSYSPTKGSKKKPAWEGIREKEGAKWYILKYATKYKQKEVPTGFRHPGRFWGKSKKVVSGKSEEIDLTEEEVRTYLAKKGLKVTKQEILPKLIIIPK